MKAIIASCHPTLSLSGNIFGKFIVLGKKANQIRDEKSTSCNGNYIFFVVYGVWFFLNYKYWPFLY